MAALSLSRCASVVESDTERIKGSLMHSPLEVPEDTVIAFSLDAGPSLDTHAFSVIAALSSVMHFSMHAEQLRFAIMLTVPPEAVEPLVEAMCRAVRSVIRKVVPQSSLRMCSTASFADVANETRCAASRIGLDAWVTFVDFPSNAVEYPESISELLELLCCSQRRYAVKRAELATSLGNHARFFAHVALLPAGVRRVLFLDADVLARVDVTALYATQLTPAHFIAAARRCATKRAAYKPKFKFHDELVKEFGLKSMSMLVNAGVLVVDLEAYCRAKVIDALKTVLRRHIAGPPLWLDGNNQPPFTIAAARHIVFVDPSWNVRVGDARGQAHVTRVKRRRHEPVDDECTAMLADPWILHAHFKPCEALPSWLCPTSSAANTSHQKHSKDDVAFSLKATCLRAKSQAQASKQRTPCRCSDVERKTSAVSYRHGHGHRRRRGRGQANRVISSGANGQVEGHDDDGAGEPRLGDLDESSDSPYSGGDQEATAG